MLSLSLNKFYLITNLNPLNLIFLYMGVIQEVSKINQICSDDRLVLNSMIDDSDHVKIERIDQLRQLKTISKKFKIR